MQVINTYPVHTSKEEWQQLAREAAHFMSGVKRREKDAGTLLHQ